MTDASPFPPNLPGAEIVELGLEGYARSSAPTPAMLLLASASQRLRDLGLTLPQTLPAEPEIALYELLTSTNDDPFGEYRALRARLDSWISAAELIQRRDSSPA